MQPPGEQPVLGHICREYGSRPVSPRASDKLGQSAQVLEGRLSEKSHQSRTAVLTQGLEGLGSEFHGKTQTPPSLQPAGCDGRRCRVAKGGGTPEPGGQGDEAPPAGDRGQTAMAAYSRRIVYKIRESVSFKAVILDGLINSPSYACTTIDLPGPLGGPFCWLPFYFPYYRWGCTDHGRRISPWLDVTSDLKGAGRCRVRAGVAPPAGGRGCARLRGDPGGREPWLTPDPSVHLPRSSLCSVLLVECGHCDSR